MKRLLFVLLGCTALTACHDDAKPEPIAAATGSASSTAATTPAASDTGTAAVLPTASATATPMATSTATATATATPTPTPTSTAIASVVAPTPSAPSAPAKPVFAHFAGTAFTVDASNPGTCKVGGDCAVALRFQTTGEYHVNDDYPYRFTANDAPGVQFQGSDGGGTFSRKTGDFQKASATSAVMNVRFRATTAGTAAISGTFKVAYCTDATCTPATQTVSLSVPIR